MSYNPSSAIIGEIRTTAAFSAPSGWAFPVGQSLLRADYAALFAALTTTSTVTFSNSSGDLLCTWSGHPFATSASAYYTAISFTAGTSTPTGITAGTVYYILPVSSSTFRLATTPGGSAITYTNAGTGTQTATAIFYGAADSTHFNLPDLRGRVAAFRDNMGGSAASRLTGSPTGGILGTILGNTGGEEGHTLVSAEVGTIGLNGGTDILDASGAGNFSFEGGIEGDASGHNNVQPSIVLNAIIYTGV